MPTLVFAYDQGLLLPCLVAGPVCAWPGNRAWLTLAVVHSGASSCGPVCDQQPFRQTRLSRVQQLQAREGCMPQGIAQQPSTSTTSTQWSGAPSQYPSVPATAAAEQHKVKAKSASHRPYEKAAAADQPSTSLWAAVANMGGGLKPSAHQLCQQQQIAQCAGSGQSSGKYCLAWFPIAVMIIIIIRQ